MRRGLSLRAALLPSVLGHVLVIIALWLGRHDHPDPSGAVSPVETVNVALNLEVVAPGATTSSVTDNPAGPASAEPRRTTSATALNSAPVVASNLASTREQPSSASAPTTGTPLEPRPAGDRRKHLSLQALGITPGALSTWDLPTKAAPSPAERREAEACAGEQRLAQSMQQQVIDHDTKLGLGPQGPILRVLSREAVGSLAAAPSYAIMLARLDSNAVLTLHLVQANRDYEKWAEVARRAQSALASAKLRPPAGARGLEIEIRVDVRDQLPSGADPGLGVDLFGVPIKRGKGDRSARLKLFEPKIGIEEIEIPSLSGETVKLPQLAIAIHPFSFEADPADLGAHAQRMVHVQVTRQNAL